MLDFAHSPGPTLIHLLGLTWQGGAIVQYLLAQFLLHWPTTAHLLYKSSFLFFASFYKGQHTLHTFLGSLNFILFVLFFLHIKGSKSGIKKSQSAELNIELQIRKTKTNCKSKQSNDFTVLNCKTPKDHKAKLVKKWFAFNVLNCKVLYLDYFIGNFIGFFIENQ